MILPKNMLSNKVAISMSGGLDSSLLTYLLCKEIYESKKDIKVFPFHGIDNTRPTSPENIQNIINFLKNSFPTINIYKMQVWDNTKGIILKTMKDRKGIAKHCLKNNINYFYNGRTSNPPKDVLDSFGGFYQKERTHDNKKPKSVWVDDFNAYLIRPWVNVDKKYIYKLYKKHNLLDTLEPLTWSCIGFAKQTNFFTEPCKTCYWCKEKYWGFNKY
tara:strand:+ start:5861 stop:6508 length:648 start_codon:yes stop_codon:yes gene_type:complete